MVVMAIFAMMAVGLNIVVGYAGLLDLGYVAFYALGAYAGAWFASPHGSEFGLDFSFGAVGVPAGLGGMHISIWLVLLIAAAIAAAGGVIIGLPTLRLRGDYLAIVTLGFGEIIGQVARNGDKDGLGFNLTERSSRHQPDRSGRLRQLALLGNAPACGLHRDVREVRELRQPVLLVGDRAAPAVTVFCSLRLRDSRLGRAWIAIREDEIAAAAMGIPLMRTKTWAYASGAFFGGVAGAFFASFKQGVFPDDFGFQISIFILCMVILGGMGNVWGVITGAALLTYLNQEGLSNVAGWWNDKDWGALPVRPDRRRPARPISDGCLNAPLLSFGIYGTIIVLVMLFRPGGLIPEERRKLEFEEGVHDEPLMDVRHAPGGVTMS